TGYSRPCASGSIKGRICSRISMACTGLIRYFASNRCATAAAWPPPCCRVRRIIGLLSRRRRRADPTGGVIAEGHGAHAVQRIAAAVGALGPGGIIVVIDMIHTVVE